MTLDPTFTHIQTTRAVVIKKADDPTIAGEVGEGGLGGAAAMGVLNIPNWQLSTMESLDSMDTTQQTMEIRRSIISGQGPFTMSSNGGGGGGGGSVHLLQVWPWRERIMMDD